MSMAEPEKKAEEKPAEEGEKKDEAQAGDAAGQAEDEAVYLNATKQVSRPEFFRLAAAKLDVEERGATEALQLHWSRPRRWDVRIWNILVKNVTPDDITTFAHITFGGTREEFAVKVDESNKRQIWVAGDEGNELYTPVVTLDGLKGNATRVFDATQGPPADGEYMEFNFDERFEWYGSYLDLERQTLRVELWNWARFRVNKFDSFYEEPLITFAKGPIFNEVPFVKLGKFGHRTVRAFLSFKLYFQEIYEFELNFSFWRASYLPTCKTLYERLLGNQFEFQEPEERASLLEADKRDIRTISALSYDSVKQSLKLVTPSNVRHLAISKTLKAKAAENARGFVEWEEWTWGNHAAIFRGTVSDLNNAVLQAKIRSRERWRSVGLPASGTCGGGGAPRGSTLNSMPLVVAQVPLRGVLDKSDIRANLLPENWVFEAENGRFAYKMQCGVLQGNIGIAHQPRYMQLEDLADEIDFRKRYLFVKVVKVDAVITPDTRPTDELDTFVEVNFDGMTKRTRVIQNDPSPAYNDEFIFELALAKSYSSKTLVEDNEQVWEEIEIKGPVHFDLWAEGLVANEHLGSCEVFLKEILADERGFSTKLVERKAKDKNTHEQRDFNVRTFASSKKLRFVWGDGADSNMFIEMWFLPDLNPNAKLKKVRCEPPLPKSLRDNFSKYEHEWKAVTEPLQKGGREFPYLAMSEWPVEVAQENFLPRFLDVIQPPQGIDSQDALAHYVGCFRFEEDGKEAAEKWKHPSFFTRVRKGDVTEHALLHASFMLGTLNRAYVCLGTNLMRERHAWVVVFQDDGSVCFWTLS